MASTLPRAIIDLDEFVESNNLMIFGDTGAGKTELVSHLPGKVLVISSENGTTVIKRALLRKGLTPAAVTREMKRFKVWPIRKWADLEDAYIWCRDNPAVFDWIAVDSATSLDQRAMRAAMEAAVNRNPEKRDIDLPDRGEHQKMQNAMKRMITDFNELPTNVLWLAQAMRREDQDGNEIVVPFIRGKDYEVAAFACAQMQAFGYYMKKPGKKKGTTERVLIWESFADPKSDINYWSKDRYDVFPKICVMAEGDNQKMTLTDLIDMISPEALKRSLVAVDTADDKEMLDALEGTEEIEDSDEHLENPLDERAERAAYLLTLKPKELAAHMESLGMTVADYKGVPWDDIVEDILQMEFADTLAHVADEPEADEDSDEDSDDLDLEAMLEEEEPPTPPARKATRTTNKSKRFRAADEEDDNA